VQTVEARRAFNADNASGIAAAIGMTRRSSDGRSDRFTYFEDDERLLVVAGPQEGDDVQLALAYGLTWAGARRLVLALPRENSTATRQRLPWFAEDRRPELWLHDASGVEAVPCHDRGATVRAVLERLGGVSPRAEFTAAATALRLGAAAGAVDLLVDWATRDERLDAAHRQNERSWHCSGQRVLSVRRTRSGLRLLAGIHGSSDDRAPLSLDLEHGRPLGEEEWFTVREAVEAGIARRLTPGEASLHRPDEHWLQSVLRRSPHLVGIEQPALREVPAWRPRDNAKKWSRGYIDLMGLDGHGDVRLVETKLASNEDPLFVLQALDYLTWAHAYREPLTDRLGAGPGARLTLHLVVGADGDGRVGLSRYSHALLDALADDVPWSLQGVRDWFGPDAQPVTEVPTDRLVPAEWSAPTGRENSSYRDACRQAATRWKDTTGTLPDSARVPAAYWGGGSTTALPFCLPAEHASLNLLPDVRAKALELFTQLQIPWHRGVGNGPSNHLLSSQVQCVNALTRMVDDPTRLQKAFGTALDIARVLQVEPGRHLTFEFIGSTDVLNERRSGRRTRGAGNTSVDAAFLYETSAGRRELALVEWKYTEEYRRGRPADPVKDGVRRQRYERLWQAPDGPLRSDVVPLEDMLVEPFYQLMRQQLFANQLEEQRELEVDAVRVVHVLAPANTAYQESLTRESHRRLGATVDEVWAELLRQPDRFRHVDPAVFCDPAVTSDEYVARYGQVEG
jgi:hypothetical protein